MLTVNGAPATVDRIIELLAEYRAAETHDQKVRALASVLALLTRAPTPPPAPPARIGPPPSVIPTPARRRAQMYRALKTELKRRPKKRKRR